MSAEALRSIEGDTGPATDESALARVLESYLAALEAGHPPDPDRLIAAHPDLAGPLRACLKVMHLAAGLSDASRLVRGDPDDDAIPTPPATSALTVLWPRDDPSSHLLLPEPDDDDAPIVRIAGDKPADLPSGPTSGRYHLLGEIARGGMGVVLRARDVDLGRDLALKVLRTRHRDDPEVVSRFVEEARIGGQLQHPGIVPVHELGTLDDRRPYFTMKLVKGRTLAALLAERKSVGWVQPTDSHVDDHRGSGGLHPPYNDFPRFLTIFEQVCQTVAYAHARRVIHRDLKPANVMVGSFGEVQVVDWGLAKVLPSGGVADEAAAQPVLETVIATIRSGPAGSGSESQAGSVLGTPSYMAPEQARGEVERIDERADVFGLGAILCEILTGRPPFVGSTREEIRAQAARGDLTDASARLDTSGADIELVALAKACLVAEVERRPRNAGVVAERVTSHLTGVQERLRSAELARVEAQARGEEEAKQRVLSDKLAHEAQARAEEAQAKARIERSRRRRTVALAASLLGLVLLGVGGWTHLAQQRMERAAAAALALREVEMLRDDARRAGDDLARWIEARDAAKAVERLLADVRDEPTRSRLTALVRDVTEAAAACESDQTLLATLVDIRSARADSDGTVTDAAYEEAFRGAEIDVAGLPRATAVAKIRSRPYAVRVAIASALDDWAAVRRLTRRDQAGPTELTEVARVADPDRWRCRLRELLQNTSGPKRLKSLEDLAKSARFEDLPAVSIHLLGAALLDVGDPTGATAVLRQGQRLYPGDVWLNFDLARCLERLARREEAIRYYMAARSLRPETAHELAHALEAKGETDQAIAVFQDLVRLRSKESRHLTCLGKALQDRGRNQESTAVLEAAVDAARAPSRSGRLPPEPIKASGSS